MLTTAQIERVMELFFFGFLCFGAWKDLRTRQIFPGFLTEQGNWTECAMDWAAALGVGGLLLALSRLTGGSIGAGDGWFFMASAAWLGWKKMMVLLMGGMILCFIFCGFVVVWGAWKGVPVKDRKIPFLPFLIPAAALLLL